MRREQMQAKRERLAVSSRVANEQGLGGDAVGKRVPASVGVLDLGLGDAIKDDKNNNDEELALVSGPKGCPGACGKLVRAEVVLVAVRADRGDVLEHRLGAHEGRRRDGPEERRDVLHPDLRDVVTSTAP